MGMPAALCAALFLLGAAPPAQESSASDVFFRLRDAYARLDLYRDEGEIEMEDRGPGGGVVRFAFTTRLDAEGRVVLRVAPLAAGAHAVTLALERRRTAAESAPAPWRQRLDEAVGSGAGDALWVPALLAGGPLALGEPEALALDGEVRCAEATCFVLVAADPTRGASFRLWVGKDDFLLRRGEVELVRGAASRVFRITVRPLPPGSPPPAGEIAVGEVYAESIDVSLVSVAVRVVDGRGRAVPGLAPADFRLRLGRREVAVEAAEWVGEPPAGETAAAGGAPPGAEELAPRGRLILFFVQTSLEPSRLVGQMRMREYARRFVDDLRPADRVAVVSFDSHLKLRCDFTAEREPVRAALADSMLPGKEPYVRPAGEPSLVRSFDRGAALRAATPERGLEVAARALVPIAGEKVVVFLGWGLGRLGAGGVEMRPEYADARRALDAARATVFALDVTEADYHSLEVGLQQVAEDTGGTYARTHLFPQAAIANLERSLAGHYVLYFRRPEEAGGPQPVRVDLRDPRRGEILAPEAALR
jgi:VWFA-related protein